MAARSDLQTIYTTEDCLVEFFDFYCEGSPFHRRRVVDFSAKIYRQLAIVIPRNSADLQRAIDLYARRLDKGYSLTDCLSMNAMKDLGLTHVLTRDVHFEQEGFVLALEE